MPYLTWMADVLRSAGLSVQEVGGWRTRGHGQMSDVRGVLLHHTAGAATGSYPSLGVVRDGRPGLAGPLAQLGLARDGSWLVIAAGQAWHAGLGYVAWCGRDNGNQHLIGVEAESTGRGDWTPAQLVSYPRGVAALLRHLGLGPDRAIGHKEWAPTRKIDPSGWPGDMNGFRAQVAGGQEEVDVDANQDRMLREVHGQITGDIDAGGPDAWGWESLVDPAVKLTPVDFIRAVDKAANETRKLVGQQAVELAETKQRVTDIQTTTDAIGAAVAQLATGGIDLDVLAQKVAERMGPGFVQAVADELSRRLES